MVLYVEECFGQVGTGGHDRPEMREDEEKAKGHCILLDYIDFDHGVADGYCGIYLWFILQNHQR